LLGEKGGQTHGAHEGEEGLEEEREDWPEEEDGDDLL